MHATRARRVHDQARKRWYAWHRQRRFARHLGFEAGVAAPGRGLLTERGSPRPIRALPA
jgi:hypothetical protein